MHRLTKAYKLFLLNYSTCVQHVILKWVQRKINVFWDEFGWMTTDQTIYHTQISLAVNLFPIFLKTFWEQTRRWSSSHFRNLHRFSFESKGQLNKTFICEFWLIRLSCWRKRRLLWTHLKRKSSLWLADFHALLRPAGAITQCCYRRLNSIDSAFPAKDQARAGYFGQSLSDLNSTMAAYNKVRKISPRRRWFNTWLAISKKLPIAFAQAGVYLCVTKCAGLHLCARKGRYRPG